VNLSILNPKLSSTRLKDAGRAVLLLATLAASTASAQSAGASIGAGLISWGQPIILFLGVGAILVALVAGVFRPELVKSAVWAAVILAVIFFIVRNMASLQAAVQV